MKKIILHICSLTLIVGNLVSCSKEYPSNAINIQEYEGKNNNQGNNPNNPNPNNPNPNNPNPNNPNPNNPNPNNPNPNNPNPNNPNPNNPNPNNPSPATSSFEKYLISAGYDKNNNGAIDNNEVDTITTLNVSSKNLTDLDGIQKFTALEMLNASDNAIKEVTFVNIVLNDLNLSNNQLTKLDVAACTNFIGGYAKFNAQNNPSLTCIRVSNAQLGSIKNYKNNWLKDNTANFDTSCN